MDVDDHIETLPVTLDSARKLQLLQNSNYHWHLTSAPALPEMLTEDAIMADSRYLSGILLNLSHTSQSDSAYFLTDAGPKGIQELECPGQCQVGLSVT